MLHSDGSNRRWPHEELGYLFMAVLLPLMARCIRSSTSVACGAFFRAGYCQRKIPSNSVIADPACSVRPGTFSCPLAECPMERASFLEA